MTSHAPRAPLLPLAGGRANGHAGQFGMPSERTVVIGRIRDGSMEGIAGRSPDTTYSPVIRLARDHAANAACRDRRISSYFLTNSEKPPEISVATLVRMTGSPGKSRQQAAMAFQPARPVWGWGGRGAPRSTPLEVLWRKLTGRKGRATEAWPCRG